MKSKWIKCTFYCVDFQIFQWTPNGPLDKWIDPAPKDMKHINAINQLSLAKDIDTINALEELISVYPEQPYLLVRLAKVYSLLQHTYGAKQLLIRAKHIINCFDPFFEIWAKKVITDSENDEKNQNYLYKHPRQMFNCDNII